MFSVGRMQLPLLALASNSVAMSIHIFRQFFGLHNPAQLRPTFDSSPSTCQPSQRPPISMRTLRAPCRTGKAGFERAPLKQLRLFPCSSTLAAPDRAIQEPARHLHIRPRVFNINNLLCLLYLF